MIEVAVKNELFEIGYGNDIVFITYAAIIIDKKILIEVNHHISQLTDGRPSAVLVDGRKVIGWTRESRLHQVNIEKNVHKKAAAIVIKSPVQQMLVNFFIRLNKPSIPLRIFTDLEKAYFWLKEF